MKTREQIVQRIDELYRRLREMRAGESDQAAMRRIEGNIGALEWVLRDEY